MSKKKKREFIISLLSCEQKKLDRNFQIANFSLIQNLDLGLLKMWQL